MNSTDTVNGLSSRGGCREDPRRWVAGCDLGKHSAKFALLGSTPSGTIELLQCEEVVHDGHPEMAFLDWFQASHVRRCAGLVATGIHARILNSSRVQIVPNEACIELSLESPAGLGRLGEASRRGGVDREPVNVISIGARGYRLWTRDARGNVRYTENDKCSSGTGETILRMVSRFGLGIDEADALARTAASAIPITARCSVFAKSEMTHFANQGKPVADILRGYFESIAHNIAAFVRRSQVAGPYTVLGGGARIRALRDALAKALGAPLLVPADAQVAEAIGAASLGMGELASLFSAPLPEDPRELLHVSKRHFSVLRPLSDASHWVRHYPSTANASSLAAGFLPWGDHNATRVNADDDARVNEPVVLGLDLGSTGSKGAIVSVASGRVLADVWDRTRGNPVEAGIRVVSSLFERQAWDVRAVGVTGSGREAVATVLRASLGEDANTRIVVLNEIVAHATASIALDPDRGASLSIIEIGGQDAKFIQVRGGRITESDLNKACSAGTGSFLEEQGHLYGVSDVAQVGRLAGEAKNPPDLGQMCTVFVAETAAEAHGQGFASSDLFAGFEYAVVQNYIHRVMGQRTLGRTVFFQGKPATSRSLAWALASVVKREVIVPPNPGVMGAWGVALNAVEQCGREQLLSSARLDVPAFLAAEVLQRSEFQCREPGCGTYCSIEKVAVRATNARKTILSGGACPKYETQGTPSGKLPCDAPDPVRERELLLAPYLGVAREQSQLVIPLVGPMYWCLPWFVTFLQQTGLKVHVARPDRAALQRGEVLCRAGGCCSSVKEAHGLIDSGGRPLFLPKILSLTNSAGARGGTCIMEQGFPEMVRSLGASPSARAPSSAQLEIICPDMHFHSATLNWSGTRELRAFARQHGASARTISRALRSARRAQLDFEQAAKRIGRRALDYCARENVPAILLASPLHVACCPNLNGSTPAILRENRAIAIPLDCYPIPAGTPEFAEVGWFELREILRAAVAARNSGDAFPLVLNTFGCGPASFGEQLVAAALHGFPHMLIECDGHGGRAGYVTRTQAFLHTVAQHMAARQTEPRVEPGHAIGQGVLRSGVRDAKSVEFIFAALPDRLGNLAAAVYRSLGLRAQSAGPATRQDLAEAQGDCSGKECLSYQCLWGSFRRMLQNARGETPATRVLVQIAGRTLCRNCLFVYKDEVNVRQLGLADRVTIEPLSFNHSRFGWTLMARLWPTMLAWDAVHALHAYTRAAAVSARDADALRASWMECLEQTAETPVSRSRLGRFVQNATYLRKMRRLIGSAVEDFLSPAVASAKQLPTVFLSGDIYVRLDPVANDDLVVRLSDSGVRVLVEPASLLFEYLADERIDDMLGLATGRLANFATRWGARLVRWYVLSAVRKKTPGLLAGLERLRRVPCLGKFARYPQGETPLTVGSVTERLAGNQQDGIVLASPWGCGPALLSESVLRSRFADAETLFLYFDGSPLAKHRLDDFVFRVRRAFRRRQDAISRVRRGRSGRGEGNGWRRTVR